MYGLRRTPADWKTKIFERNEPRYFSKQAVLWPTADPGTPENRTDGLLAPYTFRENEPRHSDNQLEN